MNIYIFKDVNQLTSNYHCNGGLVVVAEDKSMVQRLIEDTNKLGWSDTDDYTKISADISLCEDDWKNVIVYPTDKDAKVDIFIFPDAGCC